MSSPRWVWGPSLPCVALLSTSRECYPSLQLLGPWAEGLGGGVPRPRSPLPSQASAPWLPSAAAAEVNEGGLAPRPAPLPCHGELQFSKFVKCRGGGPEPHLRHQGVPAALGGLPVPIRLCTRPASHRPGLGPGSWAGAGARGAGGIRAGGPGSGALGLSGPSWPRGPWYSAASLGCGHPILKGGGVLLSVRGTLEPVVTPAAGPQAHTEGPGDGSEGRGAARVTWGGVSGDVTGASSGRSAADEGGGQGLCWAEE